MWRCWARVLAAAGPMTVHAHVPGDPDGIGKHGYCQMGRPGNVAALYAGQRPVKISEYGVDSLEATEPGKRFFHDHAFIDGVFVLGRGFVFLDALPFQSHIARAIEKGLPVPPEAVWVFGKDNELMLLWALINQINAFLLWNEADLNPYVGEIPLFIEDRP